MHDFDDPEDSDEEGLYDLVQHSGSEVAAIEKILEEDVRERTESGEPSVQPDPAYLLGSVYMAFQMVAPEKHTFDKQKLRQREMLHECGVDLLRLKAAWLAKYPHLRDAMENRRRRFPLVKGGKTK